VGGGFLKLSILQISGNMTNSNVTTHEYHQMI